MEHYNRLKREMATDNLTTPLWPRYETLDQAPPLPVIEIARGYIASLAHIPVRSYIEKITGFFDPPSAEIPSVLLLQESSSELAGDATVTSAMIPFDQNQLPVKAGIGHCSLGNPCPDGSCCNTSGNCGYGPDNCGKGNCTSNCKSISNSAEPSCSGKLISLHKATGHATAACGRDSAGGNVSCPLNVCCSYYGFCGVCPLRLYPNPFSSFMMCFLSSLNEAYRSHLFHLLHMVPYDHYF